MTAVRRMVSLDAETAKQLFHTIEKYLAEKSEKMQVTILGGLAIILQGFRQRATMDIDIAPTSQAHQFQAVCRSIRIPVDIITVASTVDLVHASTIPIYLGNWLTVMSIAPEDLIKLKLERFYKQDPEDIYAIIDKLTLPYTVFRRIARDMLVDFVGNSRSLLLSILQVVQVKYPANADELEAELQEVT